MTADEFYLVAFHAECFVTETYSVRVLPFTPSATSVKEDDMLRHAGILYYDR